MSNYIFQPTNLPATAACPLEIGLVVDQSGSMVPCARSAIDGLNLILAVQKKLPGKARVTTILFNNQTQLLHRNESITTINHFDAANYRPSGGTALLDAIGFTIDEIGNRFDVLPADERPRVIIAILTDGEENASKSFSHSQIQELVRHRTKADRWQFILISPHAAQVAMRLGIRLENSLPWIHAEKELAALFQRLSASLEAYRLGDRNYALRLQDRGTRS